VCTADSSAVLVVPTVKVRMEAHHSIPPLSLNDLLGKVFTLTFLCIWFNYSINNYCVVTVVLEEAIVKQEAESVPETQCIIFQYLGWKKSKKSTSSNSLGCYKNFSPVMGTENSVTYSSDVATGSHPEPDDILSTSSHPVSVSARIDEVFTTNQSNS
jgi:hypothetical protein